MKRILLAAAFGAISLSACAQAPDESAAATADKETADTAVAPGTVEAAPGTPDARAIAAVTALNSRVAIESVGPAPLPGFRQVVVAGQVVYVSDDGRYLFLPGSGGALIDTVAQENLSQSALAQMRTRLLETIPDSERIVFAPPNPVHTVTVFTDVECGYCRKLHSEIEQYNKQGIAVEYLAFPRMGPGSEDFEKMVSVWCADDRKAALTAGKIDGEFDERDCKNTVAMQYDIGQRVGLTGTPMILAEDGTELGGYVPPEALRKALDELVADTAGGAGPVASGG